MKLERNIEQPNGIRKKKYQTIETWKARCFHLEMTEFHQPSKLNRIWISSSSNKEKKGNHCKVIQRNYNSFIMLDTCSIRNDDKRKRRKDKKKTDNCVNNHS